jgi:hypothetical protein
MKACVMLQFYDQSCNGMPATRPVHGPSFMARGPAPANPYGTGNHPWDPYNRFTQPLTIGIWIGESYRPLPAVDLMHGTTKIQRPIHRRTHGPE